MAVKTYIKSILVQLSKNFNSREFRCGLGRGCNCTTTLIDDKLAEILQKIRDYFGAKVTITSGYRCPSYNLSIGGATGSYHSRGMAADITVEGVPPRAVAAYAQSIGVLGIGLYEGADGSFVHVDTRTYKSYWYGKKEEPRSSFGGASDYEKYAKKSAAPSTIQTAQNQPATNTNTTGSYTVQRGDTLAKIAAKYSGVTYQQIAALNGLKAPYVIYVGQKLSIPTQGSTATPAAPVPSGQSVNAVPYFCTVTADPLNVRNGPGTSNSILRQISTGTVCTIVEEKDGWGRLSNGGWVSLQYVKK